MSDTLIDRLASFADPRYDLPPAARAAIAEAAHVLGLLAAAVKAWRAHQQAEGSSYPPEWDVVVKCDDAINSDPAARAAVEGQG